MDRKWTEYGQKMDRKWTKYGPKMDLKCLKIQDYRSAPMQQVYTLFKAKTLRKGGANCQFMQNPKMSF